MINSPSATDIWNAWVAADKAWLKAIEEAYPDQRAGDLRYTAIGEGKPGTALRAAYDAFHAAGKAWRDIRDSDLTTINI